jgi:hypothetical protein
MDWKKKGLALSSGIEQLLALAAVDSEFGAALSRDRRSALARAGVALTPGEELLLASLVDARLEQLVAGVRRAMSPGPDPARRALVGGAAATLLGALATGGCASADGGDVRSAVEEFRARVTAGGGGITGIRPGGGTGFGPLRRYPWLRVRQTRLRVRGGLSREIVRRIARRHLNELRYRCQKEVGLDALASKGPVVLEVAFVITATGQVASARLRSCSLGEKPKKDRPRDKPLLKKLSTCVLVPVQRWLFPRPRGGKPVQVEQGFRFEVVDPRKRSKPRQREDRRPQSHDTKK